MHRNMFAHSLSVLLLFAAARAHPQQVVPYLSPEEPAARWLNDVDYRAYQPGDDLKLVQEVEAVTCRQTLCAVAVESGTRTVVGVVEMTIPKRNIEERVKTAIEAKMPEPSKKKPNGIIGYIDHVAVAKDWRRRGIARALLSKTFIQIGITSPNVVAMYLWTFSFNVEAVGLYETSKFVKILSPGPGEQGMIYFARYDMT